MTTTDNSVASEADLRALAVRADSGEALDLSQTAGTQGADAATDTTTEGTTNTQQQTGAALDSGKKPAADATQQQKQQPKDTTKDGQQQPPAKPESDYQKFLREKEALQKEKQRLAQTWQQVQAEKERIRQSQTQQRQQQAKPPAQAQPAGPLAKIETAELHDIAAQFEAEGDTTLAKKVRAEIARRATAEQQQQSTQQQTQAAPIDQEQFLSEWNGHLRQLEQAEPELTKPDSPLRAEVQEVLKSHVYFSERPERIREAVQFAHLRLEAKAAPELRQRVSTLETELTKLRKATAPGGGSTESRGAPKAFEDMNDAERISFLKAQAAAADAA